MELWKDVDGWTTISDELIDKINGGGCLEGVEAEAFLAYMYANQTHGNYDGETLSRRADVLKNYKITVEEQ